MAAGKHWEYRAFGKLPSEIRMAIEQFDKKFDEGKRIADEYLWRPGCKANIKIRENGLKFKKWIKQVEDGFKLWLEDPAEIFLFPLDSKAIDLLEKSLNTKVPPKLRKGCDSPLQLKDALDSCEPSIQLITIEKFRTQYKYPAVESEVLVEIADILSPVKLESICIEGPDLSINGNEEENLILLREVRKSLGLPGSLRVMGYVELIEACLC